MLRNVNSFSINDFDLSKIFWINKLNAQLGDTNYKVYSALEQAFEEKTMAKLRKIENETDRAVKGLEGRELQAKLEEANQQMADKIADIYDFAHDLQARGEIFSFEKLEEHLKSESPLTQSSFLDFMSKRLEERPIAEGTRKHHRVILNALKDFGPIKSFDDITYRNIQKWDEYAHNRVNAKSTIYDYHTQRKFLKTGDRMKKNPQLWSDPKRMSCFMRDRNESRR